MLTTKSNAQYKILIVFTFNHVPNHIPTRSLIDCKSVGSSSKMDVYPMIMLLNFLKIPPISGLVNKPANIKCGGQYSTLIYPLSILSFAKNIWYVCVWSFPYSNFVPFFHTNCTLIFLIYYIVFIAYHCAPMNTINHMLYGIYLPITTNSDSVELFTFIHCFETFPWIIP